LSSWPEIRGVLAEKQDLCSEQATWAMTQIMSGKADDQQITDFVLGLRDKSETTEEVVALVETMLEHCVPVSVAGVAVDIVGTGGDNANTVNISTMAAIVAAGAGVQVVKHGNRAVSSKSGAADVLEALGVDIEIDPEEISELVEQVGIGFCFAPRCHPAMAHAAKVRRALKVSTVFNVLGPLANPARPKSQVIGVADGARGQIMADVCAARGVKALVVHSENGLDEMTSTAPFMVWDITGDAQERMVIDPVDLGLRPSQVSDLAGGTPAENAQLAVELFAGNRAGRFTSVRDAVLLSAAAGLVAHDAAVGVSRPASLIERLVGALERSRASLDSGAASAVLEDWAGYSPLGNRDARAVRAI
jgi:anthranilate phosphoribosyltransferase